MSVPVVALSGTATVGVIPPAPPRHLMNALLALPTAVRLGRRRRAVPSRCVRLASYVKLPDGAPVPTAVDWFNKARASLSRMYLNDQYGDCVIAGKAHTVGSWTAHDSDSGGEVQAKDDEVLSAYRTICGPGDNGCYIPDVLDVMTRGGILLGGKRHKIDGYAFCDWKNAALVKTAIYLFGPITLGINLPEAWTQNAVWDVTPTRIVGGHDVSAVGYDQRGLLVSSWGRVYLLTWAAAADSRWLEECYALLSADWYGSDKLAACGVDADRLRDALAAVAGGATPPIPEPGPQPPAPPAPPAPQPALDYDVEGVIELGRFGTRGTFRGTARPVTPPSGDQVAFPELPEPVARSLADALFPVLGVTFTREGGRIRAKRGAIPPEVWAQIIQAVMQIILLILANKGAGGTEAGPQDAPGATNAAPDGSGQGGKVDAKGEKVDLTPGVKPPFGYHPELDTGANEEQPGDDDHVQPGDDDHVQPGGHEKR